MLGEIAATILTAFAKKKVDREEREAAERRQGAEKKQRRVSAHERLHYATVPTPGSKLRRSANTSRP